MSHVKENPYELRTRLTNWGQQVSPTIHPKLEFRSFSTGGSGGRGKGGGGRWESIPESLSPSSGGDGGGKAEREGDFETEGGGWSAGGGEVHTARHTVMIGYRV